MQLEPDSPSPCATSMESTPAASNAAAIVVTCCRLYWCRTACIPSRSVTSLMYRPSGLSHCDAPTLVVECAAMRSAVASAADVMMSRLPAYAGR